MKILNILTILAITAVAFNISAAKADCAGTVVTGKNSHQYCKSPNKMNWWSAYTWCEAQGRRLVTIYEACPDWDGTLNVTCNNLHNISADGWSNTAYETTNALCVSGFAVRYKIRTTTDTASALCY